MSVKMSDVETFMKMLVSWGGKFYVDDDHLIRSTADDELVPVAINNTKRVMMIPYENMIQNPEIKSTIFMPLVETIGHTVERKWFLETYQEMFGTLVWDCMHHLVRALVITEDEEQHPSDELMGLARAYYLPLDNKKRVDENTLKELERIKPVRLLRLLYSRPDREARLVTDLFDDDFLRNKLKLRSKTITTFRTMFSDIMSSRDVSADYRHTAVELGMPNVECVLNIMAKFSKSVQPYAKAALNVELFPDELAFYCSDLMSYRRCCGFLSGHSVMADKAAYENREGCKTAAYAGGNYFNTPVTAPMPKMVGPGTPSIRVPEGSSEYTGGYVSGWGTPSARMNPQMPTYGNTYGGGRIVGPGGYY